MLTTIFHRNVLINSNKFMSVHVQSSYIHQGKSSKIIHCRLISTSFTAPENSIKSMLLWNFHEHVPPLNLRICLTVKNGLRMFLQAWLYSPPKKTCCISSRLSTVFKIFEMCTSGVLLKLRGEVREVHHQAEFTCERSAMFLRAGYNMFCTCTSLWFSCF